MVMPLRCCCRKGVSFVEIVVSLFLFALAVLPVFDLMRRSGELARVSREYVVANLLAAETLNQICCMNYADIPVINGFPLDDAWNGSMLLQGQPDTTLRLSSLPQDFSRELTIEEFSARSRKVKVRVAWGKSPEHQVTLAAIREWSP